MSCIRSFFLFFSTSYYQYYHYHPCYSATTATNLQVVCALFNLRPCIVHNLGFLFLRETGGSRLWSTWELAQHILSSAFDRPNLRIAEKEKRIPCICSQF